MESETKTPPKIDTQYLRELRLEWLNNHYCYNCKHRWNECLGDNFECFMIWIEDKQNEQQKQK